MFEFIGFAIAIAGVTVLFAFLFDCFQGIKLRNYLPLVCGILLVVIVLIVNPQQESGTPRDLYVLKQLSPLLILPFFILTPLPYIEKKTGTVFSKMSVFFGALLSANFYAVFWKAGSYYFADYWQGEGLVWTVCTIVPAFLIFFGIYLSHQFLSRAPEEKPPAAVSEKSKPPLSLLFGMRKIVVLFAFLLIFWSSLYLLDYYVGNTESCGGFEVYTIDQSLLTNKMIIHLTDNDFSIFPKMAPIIRDEQYTTGTCSSSNYDIRNCVGSGRIPCYQESQFGKYQTKSYDEFSRTYHDETYLEYKGRFYFIVRSYYV